MNSLETARQETGSPLARGNRLVLAAFAKRGEHDEAGQVLRLVAQAVSHPSTHARTPGDLRAGVHEHVRRIVVDGFGGHRTDDAEIVHHRTDVFEQLTNLRAGFSKLPELQLRAVAEQLLALQLSELLSLGHAFGHRLAMHLRQLGFGVERFEMRRSPRHREPDDTPDLRRVMRRIHHTGPLVVLRRRSGRRAQQGRMEERRERQQAHSLGGAAEERATVEARRELFRIERQVHKAPNSNIQAPEKFQASNSASPANRSPSRAVASRFEGCWRLDPGNSFSVDTGEDQMQFFCLAIQGTCFFG